MPSFYYSSTAGAYTLAGAVNASATILVLNSVTGLPTSTPFKVVVEPGQPGEEIVKVTAVAGTSLTVVRGWDGTSAAAHAAASGVRHMVTAEDFTLSRTHEDATAAHGATGAVVGTTNAQTLSNKTLDGTNTFPASLATLTGTQVLTNKDLTTGNTFPSSLATLAGAQTFTGKSMDGATNTFTNIPQAAVTGLVAALAADDTDIAALQAATLDSGWVNVSIASGKAGQNGDPPQVRKVGKRVHIRWGWAPTGLTANSEIVVGTVPDGYRPVRTTYINMVGSTGNQYGMALINPAGVVSIRTASSLADYYLFPGELSGWFLD